MESTSDSHNPLRLVTDAESREEREWHGVDSLDEFLSAIGRYPLLTPADEIRLAKRVEQGDSAARERMIESNLRLVVLLAKDFRNQGLPFLDLIQEGMVGLIRAVDGFDWRLGNRFSTYARWWIQQSIRQALADSSRLIRLPARLAERVRAVERAESRLTARLQRPPTDAETAETVGISIEQLHAARAAARTTSTVSIDAPSGQAERPIMDLVADDGPDPSAALDVPAEARLEDALDALSASGRRVVELRFGFEGRDPMSYAAIADELRISATRVRQIEAAALRQLGRHRAVRDLRDLVA